MREAGKYSSVNCSPFHSLFLVDAELTLGDRADINRPGRLNAAGSAPICQDIVVGYGSRTINVGSYDGQEQIVLRPIDQDIGAIAVGAMTAYKAMGIDPGVTALEISRLTQRRLLEGQIQNALHRLVRLGVLDGSDGCGQGYRPLIPLKQLRQILIATTDVIVNDPPQELPDRTEFVAKSRRDFVAAVIKHIEDNGGFIMRPDFIRLPEGHGTIEADGYDTLRKLSRGAHPLLDSQQVMKRRLYSIHDQALADRIVAGVNTQYRITTEQCHCRTFAMPERVGVSEPVTTVIPFGGTINVRLLDGSEISIPHEITHALTYVAVLVDGKQRRLIRPDFHLDDLVASSGLSRSQLYRALTIGKAAGLIHDSSHHGFILTHPAATFIDVLTSPDETTLPFPGGQNEPAGYAETDLAILKAIAGRLSTDGQFVFAVDGPEIAASLGISPEVMRQRLSRGLTADPHPLLQKVCLGVYCIADGQEERFGQIVALYQQEPVYEIANPTVSVDAKSVRYVLPEADVMAGQIQASLAECQSDVTAISRFNNSLVFRTQFLSLPAEQQLILWYRFVAQMPPHKIAGVLKIEHRAAKQRLVRAVAALKREIGGNFDYPRCKTGKHEAGQKRKPRKKLIAPLRTNRRTDIKPVEIMIDSIIDIDDDGLGELIGNDRCRFRRFLFTLSPDQQLYLYMRFNERKSMADICAFFGWTSHQAYIVKYGRIVEEYERYIKPKSRVRNH